ncbi:UNVERIFIED_CONTAM: hypothetical protein FKN15_072781 [Acipenser sinensis]
MRGMDWRPERRVGDKVRRAAAVRVAGKGEDGLGSEDVMWRDVLAESGTHVTNDVDPRDDNNNGSWHGASPERLPAATTRHSKPSLEAKAQPRPHQLGDADLWDVDVGSAPRRA